MEKYDQSLKNIIDSKRTIDPLAKKVHIYQMFRGILFLHSRRILHRNLCPSNILFRRNKVVISDFSSAKIIDDNSKNYS